MRSAISGIGHNGGRIGVHQHHLVALFPEGLARLGAGIIELAGLADNDWPGPDQQNLVNVFATWHYVVLSALLRVWGSLKSLEFSTAGRGGTRGDDCVSGQTAACQRRKGN